MKSPSSLTVIGAANVDVLAFPDGKYIPRDSNPGRVEIAFGGVGRNIAHNLCLLGCRVRFISVFGNDAVARTLIADCRRLGMDLGPVHTVHRGRSSYFLCIHDEKGEMVSAVSDMAIMDHLTPELLEKELDDINSADAVIADCNLPEASLRFLAEGNGPSHWNGPRHDDVICRRLCDGVVPVAASGRRNRGYGVHGRIPGAFKEFCVSGSENSIITRKV